MYVGFKAKRSKGIYIFVDNYYLPSTDEESSISATEATDANGQWHQPSQYAQRPTPKSLFISQHQVKKEKHIFHLIKMCTILTD